MVHSEFGRREGFLTVVANAFTALSFPPLALS